MNFGQIEINLFSDWIDIIKSELNTEGYTTTNLEEDKISILYFALKKRLINQKPRRILISQEFSCPIELANGLELLKQKIISGDNIRPNQSRLLKNISIKDGLLFDWDIHHLHLGTTIENDGFINRTGPLLYARFDEENAYFLNIEEHGAWTMQEFLKIIHRNWPESIEEFRIKGAVGLEKNFSDGDLKDLRNAQINSLIELEPGAVYLGPGWGIVSSGDSGKAVMDHLDNRKALMKLEKQLIHNTESFLASISPNLDFITHLDLHFKLEKQNGVFVLNEVNNDFQVIINR
jgi:hypothetical protein